MRDEPKPDLACVGDQFECRYMDGIDNDLAVADDPIAGELKAGDAKFGNVHGGL